MDYVYTPPPLPSWRRWWNLYRRFPGNSVLRVLEYEKLQSLEFVGKVLDVGGGSNARYTKYLPENINLESLNIDPEIDPTHLLEPDQPFPLNDSSFEAVVCLNTLEHIYDVQFVMQEILRVLKPSGSAYISVPFIFRIHGHPDDFTRATPSWWQETCKRTGFARTELEPLVWGRHTTAGMIIGYRGFIPAKIQFHWAHMRDIAYAALTFWRAKSYSGSRGDRICAASPGWFITATKAD